jgi:hypothetical protein
MKKHFTILLTLLILFLEATSQEVLERELPSNLVEATVFFQGAQLVRTASFTAERGKRYRFLIQDVESGLIRSSLQVNAPQGISVTQINDRIRYVSTQNHDSEIATLQGQISRMKTDLEDKNDMVTLIGIQRTMLDENRNLSETQTGMSVEEWKSGVAYYEFKTAELKKKQREFERQALAVQGDMQKLVNRLEEISGTAKKQTIEVMIDAICEQSVSSGVITLTYIISEATWKPKYDLRLIELDKPLELDVNAEITQYSGTDWKNIDLILTSEDPFTSAEKPTLLPWNPQVGYRPTSIRPSKIVQMNGRAQIYGHVRDEQTSEPIPFANVVLMDGNQQVTGTTTDFEGKYRIKDVPVGSRYQVKFSCVGYSNQQREGVTVYANGTTAVDVKLRAASRSLQEVDLSKMPSRGGNSAVSSVSGVQDNDGLVGSVRGSRDGSTDTYVDGIKVRQSYVEGGDSRQANIANKITRVSYQLKQGQFIPSDGNPHVAKVDELKLGALLEHYTAPIEIKKAFLMGRVTGWEDFNLLNGSMGIHVDGTFIGESSLHAGRMEDTLILSLGTDSRILIDRKKLKNQSKKGVFGAKITHQRSYTLTIKNNRSVAVKMTVQDQIPISDNKDIEIELQEGSGATVDAETGILQWNINIESGKIWTTTFSYSVKHPVESRIYLD